MRVWYRSISTVVSLARAADRVAHVTKAVEVISTHHLLAVVAETTEAHDVTLGAGKPKYHTITIMKESMVRDIEA
jgi:hypothetical protein